MKTLFVIIINKINAKSFLILQLSVSNHMRTNKRPELKKHALPVHLSLPTASSCLTNNLVMLAVISLLYVRAK